MNEQQFYEELATLQDGPLGEYDAIMKQVASVKSGRRAVYALAALLILAVGLLTYSGIGRAGSMPVQLASDDGSYTEALDAVSDYFDGSALDEDFEIYAYSYNE